MNWCLHNAHIVFVIWISTRCVHVQWVKLFKIKKMYNLNSSPFYYSIWHITATHTFQFEEHKQTSTCWFGHQFTLLMSWFYGHTSTYCSYFEADRYAACMLSFSHLQSFHSHLRVYVQLVALHDSTLTAQVELGSGLSQRSWPRWEDSCWASMHPLPHLLHRHKLN